MRRAKSMSSLVGFDAPTTFHLKGQGVSTMSKAQEIVINIGPDGSASGLHFDEFDLGFLGKKEISRASEIFFNDMTQKWDVVLPGNSNPVSDDAKGFATYEAARHFEVDWLQGCMKIGAKPDDPEGIKMAETVRKAMI